MNARILTAVTVAAAVCGVLPAKAADPQMLSLLMPDAKVVAGVNVAQAKATPFGQYVLAQISLQGQELDKLQALVGLDPRRDITELLVASAGVTNRTGLALARGNFASIKIAALAQAAGAKTETEAGVTIFEDPKQTAAIAFLDSSLAAIGDPASVKAAIRRRAAPASLPAALAAQVAKWSLSQDAWAVSLAPLSLVPLPKTAPAAGALQQQPSFQSIQQLSGGVKFGTTVIFSAQAVEDTAQNAATLAGMLQFLTNLAQAQAKDNPAITALAKSLSVATDGAQVSVTLSMPAAQFEQLVKPHANASGRKQVH